MQIKGKARKITGPKAKKAMLFSYRKNDTIDKNYMKYLRLHLDRIYKDRGLKNSHVFLLLYVYDLEFFTIRWISEQWGVSEVYMIREILKPLERAKYLASPMNNGRYSDEDVQAFGTKHQLKKYSISQAGRLFIQRFYKEMEAGGSSASVKKRISEE